MQNVTYLERYPEMGEEERRFYESALQDPNPSISNNTVKEINEKTEPFLQLKLRNSTSRKDVI